VVAESPGSFPYVPLDARGWRLSMGLRPLDIANWLEVDEHLDEERALKTQLLDDEYDVVVATTPEGDEASRELLQEIRENLHAHHLGVDTTIDEGEHPIVAASRLVQEDLCVLVRDDAWRLRAACVCFPSRWDLASKIGATLDDIHAPVPGYDVGLARPTNAFFERLKPDRAFWRLNWTLLDSPTLFQPANARRSPDAGVKDWYFRVERQTLRALPRTKAVVFTIRTFVTPATQLCQRDANFAETLINTLETAPASVQEYKGWTGVAERLRDALGEAS
jgi:dimethylamine monooxygenase subunit A